MKNLYMCFSYLFLIIFSRRRTKGVNLENDFKKLFTFYFLLWCKILQNKFTNAFSCKKLVCLNIPFPVIFCVIISILGLITDKLLTLIIASFLIKFFKGNAFYQTEFALCYFFSFHIFCCFTRICLHTTWKILRAWNCNCYWNCKNNQLSEHETCHWPLARDHLSIWIASSALWTFCLQIV